MQQWVMTYHTLSRNVESFRLERERGNQKELTAQIADDSLPLSSSNETKSHPCMPPVPRLAYHPDAQQLRAGAGEAGTAYAMGKLVLRTDKFQAACFSSSKGDGHHAQLLDTLRCLYLCPGSAAQSYNPCT
eukprot:1162140-Pelagomonas_calceolata.AAC.4